MENLKKQHPPPFKAKVALEALKEIKTSAELAIEYQVHPSQIWNWKTLAKKGLVDLFTDRRKEKKLDKHELIFNIPVINASSFDCTYRNKSGNKKAIFLPLSLFCQ